MNNSFTNIYNQRKTSLKYKYVLDENGIYFYWRGINKVDQYPSLAEGEQKYSKQEIHCIVGTALSFTAALWQYTLCRSTLWNWFRGLVTDGYLMILFSPLILLNWMVVTILYSIPFLILSILVALSAIWMIIIEYPASFMNKETIPNFWEDLP
jgi:hypothetical protein